MSREVVTRRNLPHWYMPGAVHFVTFRLAGTIPAEVLERFKARKGELVKSKRPNESRCAHRARVHKQLFAEYDRYLDRNREIRWLADPRIAALVRRSLYFWHGKKYGLLCWCVMPNHVHVLLQPFGLAATSDEELKVLSVGEKEDMRGPLSEIMHSLKGYTAHQANAILSRKGEFWQHESYDHWVRDEDGLERIIAYIGANPVEAGLAYEPHEFYWCSVHDRYLHDGAVAGGLCFDLKEL
jgi:putative DNA methylase